MPRHPSAHRTELPHTGAELLAVAVTLVASLSVLLRVLID